MAPQLVGALEWQSLTANVNDIKSPNNFLLNMLIGSKRRSHATQTLEIGKWLSSRKMVPFVKAGAQAFPLQGVNKEFIAVKAPNIRVKIAFEPSPLLFGRTPGTNVFVAPGEGNLSAVEEHIALDMQSMADQISNREEWLIAQALTGVIDYSQTDDVEAEAFQFDYSRAAGHTIVLTGADLWDTSTSDVPADVRGAKRLVAEATGLQLTDVVMGLNAANAFLNNAGVLAILDRRNAESKEANGPQEFANGFRADGAYYCGRVLGLDWWEYNRTVLDADGSSVQLIGSTQAFFVSQQDPISMEYAAIPDMDAFESGLLQSQRFSKSWVEKDPSVVVALTHSRPFPLLLQPEAMVQMTVSS